MTLDTQAVGLALALVAVSVLGALWAALLFSWALATARRGWQAVRVALALAVVWGWIAPAPRRRPA